MPDLDDLLDEFARMAVMHAADVVAVDRKIEGKQLPYDAVKDKIAAYLNEKVERKAVAQYIHTLIQAAEIKGFDFAVSDSPLLQ